MQKLVYLSNSRDSLRKETFVAFVLLEKDEDK